MKDGPFIIGPSPHVQNPTHVGTNKPFNPIIVDLNLYWKKKIYHTFEFFI
jgi:hypothetical protein